MEAPLVMAILNVTPDSFSDGGELATVGAAVDRTASAIADGAGMVDVGGESTRPGATPVDVEEELERVIPVVEALAARFDVPLSVDTRKSTVAAAALAAGADAVNDVSALAHDPAMGSVVADAGAGVVLMHMRGDPTTMRGLTSYDDVVADVVHELRGALERARAAGIATERIVVDPGIGFAKTAPQSLALIGAVDSLLELGRPVLIGPSRKSFLGALLDVPTEERTAGTVAACVLAYLRGARIFRVHDIRPVVQALHVAHAVPSGARRWPPTPAPAGASTRRERAQEDGG